MAWQQLVWAKEILQILDRPEHHTGTKTDARAHDGQQGRSRPQREQNSPKCHGRQKRLPAALGSKVPRDYRNSLRDTKARPSLETLEGILLVKKEFIERLLSNAFEAQFEQALKECDD
jgi:hypothetical protein